MQPQVVEHLTARVADLMTRHPIVVASSERAEVAADLLRTCRIRHLPVMDDGQLVGVVSVRDLLCAIEGMRVRELMSAPPTTITAEAGVEAACHRLLERTVSSLPVVDGARLLGIFTSTDALRFAAAALEDEGTQLGRDVPIAQLMTPRPLLSVGPDATLAASWRFMKQHRVRHLPVMRGEELLGLLSDRDILASGGDWLEDGSPDSARGRSIQAAEAMSVRVNLIGAERSAAEAAHVLLRRRVGALPVMRGGSIVGILTIADFLYWIVNRV